MTSRGRLNRRQAHKANVEAARLLNHELDKERLDFDRLQDIALRYGFVSNDRRRVVWARLLCVDYSALTHGSVPDLIVTHPDMEQVDRDVDRSLYCFTRHLSEKRRNVLRQQLGDMINAILSTHPELSYYQGFHDVCSVMLLIGGPTNGFLLAESLCCRHIRHVMDPDFSHVMKAMAILIPLVRVVDAEVADYISSAGVSFHFAFSWVITWFAHDFDDLASVVRIFDFLLSSHPLMVVYMAAVITANKREEILAEEHDSAMIYKACSTLSQHIDLPTLFQESVELFQLCPPSIALDFADVALPRDSHFLVHPFPEEVVRPPPPVEPVDTNVAAVGSEGGDLLSRIAFFGIASALGLATAVVFG